MAKKKISKALQKYASEFARLGGLSKSPARAAASRNNGKLGGRPSDSKSPKKKPTPKK